MSATFVDADVGPRPADILRNYPGVTDDDPSIG